MRVSLRFCCWPHIRAGHLTLEDGERFALLEIPDVNWGILAHLSRGNQVRLWVVPQAQNVIRVCNVKFLIVRPVLKERERSREVERSRERERERERDQKTKC